MLCLHPIQIKHLTLRCGKCLACKNVRTREWSTRLFHESSTIDHKCCFVTLTYHDKYLPKGRNLCKRDVQLFLKRLRKRLSMENRRLKYYICGEYGPKTLRPHYHAILFGCTAKDSTIIFQAWGKCTIAHFDVQDLPSADAMSYVTGYARKKILPTYNDRIKDCVSEFRLQSLGLGRSYIENHPQKPQIQDTGLIITGPETYNKMLPLRYYRKILGLSPEVVKSASMVLEEEAIKEEMSRLKRSFPVSPDSHLRKLALCNIKNIRTEVRETVDRILYRRLQKLVERGKI